jgi:micrococcal nuclease
LTASCDFNPFRKLQIFRQYFSIHNIRLVGIDAPEVSHKKYEPGQPFGQQSTKHLAGLVLSKTVEIKSHGPDRYGRSLGEVFLDGNNINLELVKAGLAEVYRGTLA